MVMIGSDDDVGHRANGLTAQKFREATEEERATYRRWLRGIIFLYFGLLFVSGVAVATYSGTGRSQLTNLSVQQTVAAAR
jgi:hypothetical protein